MTLTCQPTTLFHHLWITSWDFDGAFYSTVSATLVKQYNHIKRYALGLYVIQSLPLASVP